MPKLSATAGQLLINDALPADMRDYSRKLDKKGVSRLLAEVAERYPEKYREISFKLAQLGKDSAYFSGGNSFNVLQMQQSDVAKARRQVLSQKLNALLDDDSLSDEVREKKIVELMGKMMNTQQQEIFDEAFAKKNPLAIQLVGAGRGNKMTLASLLGSDGLYMDHRENVIPVPIMRSYSQGLSPAEYWAATYGARHGVMATKFAVRDAGYLCLGRDTEVRMADWSTKPIQDICVGDVVLGADRTGRTFPVPVTATFCNGQKELHEFKFRYGKSRTRFLTITATKDHKCLAEHLRRRRKRPDPKLQIEISQEPRALGEFECRNISWTALVPPQRYVGKGKTEPLAGIIGFLIAEGGLTTNHVGVSIGDTELEDRFTRLLATHGFSLKQRNNKKYEFGINDEFYADVTGQSGGGIAVGTHRHRLKRKLRDLGLLGCLAPQKGIPSGVFTWSNRCVAEFLRWLFAGDGGVSASNNSSTPVIKLGMTSVSVVTRAAELLADRFGIYGQVSTVNTKGRKCSYNPKYKANHDICLLTISDRESVIKFAKLIGFVAGNKQKRLEALLKDLDPAIRRDRFLFHFVSSKPVGLGDTYDIEVDHPDHLFVLANGAIVSNSKQLNQIVHRSLVTALDDENEPTTLRGLPVDVDDDDNEGALLAAPVAGFARNTILTPKILKSIRSKGINRILVRSPSVTGTPDGGVYARDVGVREFGRLPMRGENVGLAAAQALSEPISQGQLSAKHAGGVAGGSKAVSGFDYINQLVQVPKTFRAGAAHSTVDGRVQSVEQAPAGGFNITIEGEKHYVADGYDVKVKRGDKVEAGDVISSGTPNPAIITKYKGIGEGRRYFVKAFRDAMRDSNMQAHRRNVELLARGMINHIRLTDEIGDYAPDDVIPYSSFEAGYEPREGSRKGRPAHLIGRYLERPYLHYTIGTRIRPSMIKDFDEFNVKEVEAHDEPPPFEPEMVRGMANLQHDPDWMTRMFGSGLKSSLLKGVHRGATADETGTSFVAGRARAVDFGRKGKVMTPEPF